MVKLLLIPSVMLMAVGTIIWLADREDPFGRGITGIGAVLGVIAGVVWAFS